MITPADVHPSHDVRMDGWLGTDPACQRCGAASDSAAIEHACPSKGNSMTANQTPSRLFIRYSNDGQHIRKWSSTEAFDGASSYVLDRTATPPGTLFPDLDTFAIYDCLGCGTLAPNQCISDRCPNAVERAAMIEIARLRAVEPWRPIDADALKDMVWLLVDYSERDRAEHPLADATYAATIGFWQEGDADEGEWKLAGWCWSHDCFTEGRGRVIAWKPIGFMLEYTGDWPLPGGVNPPADCVTPALLANPNQAVAGPSSGLDFTDADVAAFQRWQSEKKGKITCSQIAMGHGKVDVGLIEWQGRSGILLRPRSMHIPIGELGELSGGYWPSGSDVVIWIDDPAGADVIINELTPLATRSPAPAVAANCVCGPDGEVGNANCLECPALITQKVAEAIAAERERCAKIASDHQTDDGGYGDCNVLAREIAAAIRQGQSGGEA